MAAERTRARVFGEVAGTYERRRPGYPGALYEEVLALLDRPERALEAGAGTGKATIELARRGLEVLAYEPDRAMAAILRRNVQGLSVLLEERPFEEWDGEAGVFDLVFSAQAWHWIDRDRGHAVAKRALRSGGVLAVWWNQPDAWDGPLREALDAAYAQHAPRLAGSIVNRSVHQLAPDSLTLEGFEPVGSRSYSWTQRYDAHSYTQLLQTHSDHRLLQAEELDRLLRAVAEVIERVGGGEITYPYRTDLLTAKRTDSP